MTKLLVVKLSSKVIQALVLAAASWATAANASDADYFSYDLPANKPTVLSTQHRLAVFKKYDEVILSNPRDYIAFYERGRIKELNHDPRGALVDFDSSLRVNPLQVDSAEAKAGPPKKHRAWAHQERGYVLCQLKRLKAGVASFTCAIAVRPNFADNFQNRAAAYLQLGQSDQSRKDALKAAELRKAKLADDCCRPPWKRPGDK